jgi:nucleoside-triphosphatase
VTDGRKLLLEGRPAAGKTTVAERLAGLLGEGGVSVSGFITTEIRERGRRVGFSIETFDGKRGELAHVDLSGPPRVGKYGVDLAVLERIGVPALRPRKRGVVIVDELGKMELASKLFREAVVELFDNPGTVVATVQSARHPLTDALKRRRGVETLQVTHQNRDLLPERLAESLLS